MNGNMYTPETRWAPAAQAVGAAPFIGTVFLSASLVFLVQPMFARMATPLLGGSPNVWNVSLVCFQGALLAGYGYAHLLNHLVRTIRGQVIIHGALLLLAALVLPLRLSGLFGAPDPAAPALWLIAVFSVSIAPPFAIISATAPLIQAWYARTGRADAHDPYYLYAASNAGSLIGLAAYPLLLEPLAPLAVQAGAWSGGYMILAGLVIACGLVTLRASGQPPFQTRGAGPDGQPPVLADGLADRPEPAMPAWGQRFSWIILAFVPSSLLMGVTTHISTDIASAPFLWAPPLMLYITSFIIVFSKRPPISTETAKQLLPLLAGLSLITLSRVSGVPTIPSFAIHLATLFIAAIACHGLLAEGRPQAGRLTEFYLLMSLGGVLGGAFNALLVPLMFTSVAEYPLMLIAAALLMPQRTWFGPAPVRLWTALALACLVAAILLQRVTMTWAEEVRTTLALFAVTGLGLFMARHSRLGSTLILASMWGISILINPTSGGYSERGFFGVVKVLERGDYTVLVHGVTLHGAQARDEDRLRPISYYAAETPIGQVFSTQTAPGRIGVLGLGVGSVACYARPGQDYTFFEIDPIVARIARDPQRFTYISDCKPDARIVLGDGRLTLADEPEGSFDLLLVDAFSSDAIPAHLLTREAIELYLSRLTPDGILLLHVYNRNLALETVVGRIAGEIGVPGRRQQFTNPEGTDWYRISSSAVVALANRPGALDRLAGEKGWEPLQSDGGRVWTDDYSNIPGAIWNRRVNGLQ